MKSAPEGEKAARLMLAEEDETATRRTPASPVTVRAVLLGLFGAVSVSILQVVGRVRPETVVLPFQSVLTLFSGPVFLLFLLAVVNGALKRWWPKAANSAGLKRAPDPTPRRNRPPESTSTRAASSARRRGW